MNDKIYNDENGTICYGHIALPVVHASSTLCVPSLWMDFTTRGNGQNQNLLRFANPNSQESIVGTGLWQVKDKIMHFMHRSSSYSCYLHM